MVRHLLVAVTLAAASLAAIDVRAEQEQETVGPFKVFGRRRAVAANRYVNPFRIVVLRRITSSPFGLPQLTESDSADAVAIQAAAAQAAAVEAATVQETQLAAAASEVAEAPQAAVATTGSSSRQPTVVSSAGFAVPPPYVPPPRSPFRPAPRPPF